MALTKRKASKRGVPTGILFVKILFKGSLSFFKSTFKGYLSFFKVFLGFLSFFKACSRGSYPFSPSSIRLDLHDHLLCNLGLVEVY